MPAPGMVRIGVDIPEPIRAELKSMAARERTTVAQIINDLIRNYLACQPVVVKVAK